jgi:hypothetical protein
MSTAVVCLEIKNVFNIIFCPVLLYKLFRIEFLTHLFKPIRSCLSNRKLKISFAGKICMATGKKAGYNKVLFTPYTITDSLKTSGEHLTLFADKSYLYVTDRKEGYVLRNQRRYLMLQLSIFLQDLHHSGLSFTEWMEHLLCKSYVISQHNL